MKDADADVQDPVTVEMGRRAWEWLLSAAYMGLSSVVYEEEKVAAIKAVEGALGR